MQNLRLETRKQIVAVPSEDVIILALTLPQVPQAQRAAAALFAAEPYLSQPIEEMQLVLGPQTGTGRNAPWLAVILAQPVMADLMAGVSATARLVPDVLLLPRPADGQWRVARQQDRFLARLPDGTGFAASEAGFRAIWGLSGQPPIAWHQGVPLPDLPMASAENLPLPPVPEASLARFDLAAGRVPAWRQPWKLAALAAVLLLGITGHTALTVLDVQRFTRAAEANEAQLGQVLTARGIAASASVEADAATALRQLNAGQSPDFLAVMSDVFAALAPKTGTLGLQDISYDGRSGRLTLTLIAPDLGALQDASSLLTKAGLQADLGTSTIGDGGARASVSITRGAAG